MELFSKIASWVFLPLFMPIYALLIVFYVPSNQDYIFNEDCMYFIFEQNKRVILFEYLLFGALLPGLSLVIMRFSGMITDIEMGDKSERHLPIIMTIMYCIMLYTLLVLQFRDIPAPKYIFSLSLSGVIITVVHYFFNIWKKISIHAGGAGIMFGFLLAYILEHQEYQLWIIGVAILASGIVMTARLYLKKHTMSEVVIGWFVGSFITFAVNYLY